MSQDNPELDGTLLSVDTSRKELEALEAQLAKRHGLVGNDIREQLIERDKRGHAEGQQHDHDELTDAWRFALEVYYAALEYEGCAEETAYLDKLLK